MDKRSSEYIKSSYENKCYGDDSYTTVKRDFNIDGRSRENVRDVANHIKMSVMP